MDIVIIKKCPNMKNTQHYYLLEKYKSKLQWDITSYQSEWLSSKSLQINAAEGMEKRKPFYTVGGNVNWWSPLWRTVWGFLKKTKNRVTIKSSNPTPGHISRKDENSNSKRYMHLSVHRSTIFFFFLILFYF